MITTDDEKLISLAQIITKQNDILGDYISKLGKLNTKYIMVTAILIIIANAIFTITILLAVMSHK